MSFPKGKMKNMKNSVVFQEQSKEVNNIFLSTILWQRKYLCDPCIFSQTTNDRMIYAPGAIDLAVVPRTEHVSGSSSPKWSYADVLAGKGKNLTVEGRIVESDVYIEAVEHEKADSRQEEGGWTLVNASKKGRRSQRSKMMMINARDTIGESIPRRTPPRQKRKCPSFRIESCA